MRTPSALGFTPEQIRTMELPPGRPRQQPSEGEPEEAFRRIFEQQGTIVGVWESTPGRYPAFKHGRHSIMYVLSGHATVIDADGREHRLVEGSVLIEPDGWTGEWHVHETLRKFYVISPVPS